MTSLFQFSTSLLTVAIFQQHERMAFTYHNSYGILEFVLSLYWTTLSCVRKIYSNKATLLLSEAIATTIIRLPSWSNWPLRNIHISNDNGSFTFYVDLLSSITAKSYIGLDCIYEYHGGFPIRSSNCLPFASFLVHSRCLLLII
jgi:hypothetical protein